MSSKIFCHIPRRRLKSAEPRPPAIAVEDPAQHRARVAAQRRETERIEADRRRRMLERHAARVVQATPPKDQSDRDADWFAAHPHRSHWVRRKVDGEIPSHLDNGHWKWVAIRQVEPGTRIRLAFNLKVNSRALRGFADDEAGAAFVFETIADDPKAERIRSTDVDNAFAGAGALMSDGPANEEDQQ